MKDKIIIGSLGKPYGVKGWLHLYSFADPAKKIFEYSPLYLNIKEDNWSPLTIEKFSPHADHWVAKIKRSNDRDQAKIYTNTHIGINCTQLPTLSNDQYYWRDLEGLSVFTKEGKNLGVIDSLFETGSNDVMVVKNVAIKKERLIPYRREIILSIDLENKKMVVDWEEGF